MPGREVASLRRSLKPLVDLALEVPEERLGEAERLLDEWLRGRVAYRRLLEGLARLAGRRRAP